MTCVGIHGWKNQTKVQGPCLVHNLLRKSENKSFDSGCKIMKTKVASKDLGVEENGVRMWVA